MKAHFVRPLVLFGLLAACQDAITPTNYERIENGMTMEEVEAILGPPSESKSAGIGSLSGTVSLWKGKDGTTISVQFVNGKVVSKQFLSTGEDAGDP